MKISLGILKMFADQIGDMSAKEVYAFLKHLPDRVDIDELAKSVGDDAWLERRLSRLDSHSPTSIY